MAKQIKIVLNSVDENTVELIRANVNEASTPKLKVHMFNPDDLENLQKIDEKLTKEINKRNHSIIGSSFEKVVEFLTK